MPEEKLLLLYGACKLWSKLPGRLQAQLIELALRALLQTVEAQAGKKKKPRRQDTRSDGF